MFKARMKFAKEGRAKYISHLDLMHTMQRAMARCEMPLWFTEGFNQHAYVSVALPLSTGYSGEWELLDFNLLTESVPAHAVETLNSVFPEGLRAIEIYPLSDGGMPLREIAWSKYRITWSFAQEIPEDFVKQVSELFARDTIEIVKRSKRGEKLVNMRDFFTEIQISEENGQVIAEVITAAGNNNMSPEYLTRAIEQYLPQYSDIHAGYHRLCVYNEKMQAFR
ncbi:MAG: TIGR03936 family radical SAM-associated protein [Butyricicoccus pullicaecorum]|nr:TIGR03936 family radical SAM-associated protein [Butyricicoccus pullicaecorum]